MSDSQKYKIIDIFSWCGGLSYGFENTWKFETVLAIDKWDIALKTLQKNKPNSNILIQDMSLLQEDKIIEIKKEYGDIKVVIWWPPCQGFSQAGQRNAKDPRNQLYKSYIHFIKIVNPEWFVFENVHGILSMTMKDGKKFIDAILKDFNSLWYSVTLNALSAKDFWVPQDRKRVIIIWNRNGKDVPYLKPTTLNQYITVRDVIWDLESLESNQRSLIDPYHFALEHSKRHISWLKNVPEGHSAHEYKPENWMTAKWYWTTYKRIWWDRPSPTITTCFSSISSQNNVHPLNTRALTIREAMRIQTFPDSFQFEGSWRDIRTQIGNAVPPKLWEEIAKQLLSYFSI